MLSIGKLAAGRTAGRYYAEQVARGREDYYAGEGDGEACGSWVGSGARGLGLAGEVDNGEVERLLAGRDPATSALLGRPMADGSVAGFDLTFKPPKSVSVLFGIGDRTLREQLVDGHERALADAVGYLERNACGARRGHGGLTRVDGRGFVAAAFRHRSSRAGDPLLHTHVVVTNRVQGPDGRWTALDGKRLYAHLKTAGFIYQAAIRRELGERLGLSWTTVVRGTAEVQGVPSQAIKDFSRRRIEIERTMQERGEHSLNAANTAALATRKAKSYDVPIGALRETWRRRAAYAGFDRPDVEALLATPRELHEPPAVSLDDLTRHTSTFTRRDVIQAVAAAHRDGARASGIEQMADALLTGPDVVPVARRSRERAYTTRDLLQIERELLERARAERNAGRAVARPDLIDAAIERHDLEGEQAQLVRSVTSSGDAITVVRAPAGAGKTHALEAAKEAWVRTGVEVTGCALSARAAAELRDQAALETTTIARLRVALDHGYRLPVGGVLIVDEAAMVGTRDLAELTRRADEVGCKVVLVGDDRQLPEIEAGGAFRAIAERHGATELSILRRQRELEERRALTALRDGRTEEWALSLAMRDRIVTAPTSEALRARLVDDWWQAQREGDDALMIAHRRHDVTDLNRRARQRMRDDGRLAGPAVVLGELEYAVGDDISCRHNDRRFDLINGSRGSVREVSESWMRVSLSDGRDVVLPAGYVAEHVEHGYATTAHRAQGSTVDRTFVLGSDELCREWGYTAMSRHREEARFYVTAPAPYLNRPARSLERQEELVDVVARLFKTTQHQELALEALDRTPGAAELLEHMDRAAASAEDAAARAEVLAAEHDLVPRFHRSRRREFERHAYRFRRVAADHSRQLAALADAFDRLASGDASTALALPAGDPVDLGGLPGSERNLDFPLSPGM